MTPFLTLLLLPFLCLAGEGPHAPEAGRAGSTAISINHEGIIGWASGWRDYMPCEAVEDPWKNPNKALGIASGITSDVVSLGMGGSLTLSFDFPIENRNGYDFAAFGNSFSDTFLELAFVEVSTDGQTFVRFPNESLTKNPVHSFGHVNPTHIDGFAGKYRAGFGTPFDLDQLKGKEAVISGEVNLSRIFYVRLVDVVGDGSQKDSHGNPVYAPHPTRYSAGFDLDGVAVLSGVVLESSGEEEKGPPVTGGIGNDSGCFIGQLIIRDF
ncbi:PEP-CTERM sorting domain-containing protein [Desulfobotulus mexicanus]|uniref:PEP-CTERM sorting domain-containing protein n=1 Tax=Desulfobotulus mexicanus TaxID=2586642 RepID=A0A5S5MCE5_9BACT|nr:PEP-CTERM sorting domain-containing protein [Desulfobotulus mexicanus]TYT73398.1 PEP-CTERM sorting domain-containing protein [Desulfobotulus mexicanus]